MEIAINRLGTRKQLFRNCSINILSINLHQNNLNFIFILCNTIWQDICNSDQSAALISNQKCTLEIKFSSTDAVKKKPCICELK